MEIGLYFGSFNPVHHGHLIIASHVANNTSCKQIWFVVSPHNPLKDKKTLLNEYNRLHLVNVAIEGEENRFKATDIEFRLPKPSYTINTLVYLKEKYPNYTFSIIMGGDSFENLPKWKNYEKIIADYKIYVYQRPGTEIKGEIAQNVEFLNAPLIEISSTAIRKMVQQGNSIRYLVPDSVLQEIKSSGYYKY
jgi:nicotinate-nucleotide adenylyltransferase